MDCPNKCFVLVQHPARISDCDRHLQTGKIKPFTFWCDVSGSWGTIEPSERKVGFDEVAGSDNGVDDVNPPPKTKPCQGTLFAGQTTSIAAQKSVIRSKITFLSHPDTNSSIAFA